jgi:hypothetical protein
VNLGGSHDQAQNQAKSCDPFNRPKDCQARVWQAIGACITQIGRETGHQARPYYCDAADGCGRYDRVSRYRNTMAATFGAWLSRRCGPQKAQLNLVSEQTDKGRVYRIKDGNASPASADRAKQAA